MEKLTVKLNNIERFDEIIQDSLPDGGDLVAKITALTKRIEGLRNELEIIHLNTCYDDDCGYCLANRDIAKEALARDDQETK